MHELNSIFSTIIVAALDAEEFLAECLQSVRDQTVSEWECIVIDDGSADDTAVVAASFVDLDPRFQVITQSNKGTAEARNVGVRAASSTTQYFAFLDADDVWLPNTLATLRSALRLHPDAVGAYGEAEYIDAQGQPYELGRHPQAQRQRRRMGRFDLVDIPSTDLYTFESLIVSGTLWPTAVALHRRSVIERVGGFDPVLRQVQDWDLYLRMSRFGPFLPINEQVAWYRQHPANVTKRSDRVAFYSLAVRHKASTSTENTALQHRLSRRVWRRLVSRWMLWTVQAAGASARRGEGRETLAAAIATVRFTSLLLRGRPVQAEPKLAEAIATYASARAFTPRND